MRGRFSTIDPDQLRMLIEQETLTQKAAAQRLGVCLSAVERACKRFSIKTQRTGPRSGSGHPNWKGGRVVIGGYIYLHEPDHQMATSRGYVSEHRKVAADRLGRDLTKDEAVHHIDGDTQNNSPENLQVFPNNAEHLKVDLAGKIPDWTPEGLERIQAGVAKAANQRRLKPRAQETRQSVGHSTDRP